MAQPCSAWLLLQLVKYESADAQTNGHSINKLAYYGRTFMNFEGNFHVIRREIPTMVVNEEDLENLIWRGAFRLTRT